MELTEYIRIGMQTLRGVAAREGAAQRQFHDEMADANLVQYAHRAMEQKLALARSKGRGGWWNADECPVALLREMLRSHVDKGDMRDVLNLAAMIYVREVADAPEPADQPGAGL